MTGNLKIKMPPHARPEVLKAIRQLGFLATKLEADLRTNERNLVDCYSQMKMLGVTFEPRQAVQNTALTVKGKKP